MHTIMHEVRVVEQVIINSTWQKKLPAANIQCMCSQGIWDATGIKTQILWKPSKYCVYKDSSFMLDSANLYADETVA